MVLTTAERVEYERLKKKLEDRHHFSPKTVELFKKQLEEYKALIAVREQQRIRADDGKGIDAEEVDAEGG